MTDVGTALDGAGSPRWGDALMLASNDEPKSPGLPPMPPESMEEHGKFNPENLMNPLPRMPTAAGLPAARTGTIKPSGGGMTGTLRLNPHFNEQLPQLVAAGKTPKEIADQFGVSETWMKKYLISKGLFSPIPRPSRLGVPTMHNIPDDEP